MIMMGSLMLRRELILPVPRPRLFLAARGHYERGR
jgi:hypothetical protein